MPITPQQVDVAAQATNAAQTKYAAGQSAIERAIQQAVMAQAANETALQGYGTGGRQEIGRVYDELGGNLENNRQAAVADLGTQVGQVGRGYRDAAVLGDAARQQAIQRLQELGGTINAGDAAVASAANPIEQLAAQIIGQNAQFDATRTGNLRTWAAQQDALMKSGIGLAAQEGARQKSTFEQELLNLLAQNRAQGTQEQFDMTGRLNDLLLEKGAYTQSKADELGNLNWERVAQAFGLNQAEADSISQNNYRQAQLAMEASKAQAALDQAAQEMAFRQAQAGKDDSLGWAKLAQGASEFDRTLALQMQELGYKYGGTDSATSLDEWAKRTGVGNYATRALVNQYNNAAKEIALAQQKINDPVTFNDLLPESKQELYQVAFSSPADYLRNNNLGGITGYQTGKLGSVTGTQSMTYDQMLEALRYLGG